MNFPELLFILCLAIAIGGAVWLLRLAASSESEQPEQPKKQVKPERPGKPEEQSVDLAALAETLEPVMDKMSHPSEALEIAEFRRAVDYLESDRCSVDRVSNYALGANWILSCAGFEALAKRDDSRAFIQRAVQAVPGMYAWPLYFLIRFVAAKSDEPVAARILCGVQHWWSANPLVIDTMTAYLRKVVDDGEKIVFDQEYAELDEDDREELADFIRALPGRLQGTLDSSVRAFENKAIDWKFLRSIGAILDRESTSDPVFETRQLEQQSKEVLGDLESNPGRSLLLVGPSGVGKSAFARLLSRELISKGWTVVKTSAAALIADQAYIGQIEGQVQRLSRNATVRKKVALYFENMSELRQLGRYTGHDTSVLDLVWPDIAARKVFIIGETSPTGLQALLKDQPSLPTVMKVMMVDAASEEETVRIAGQLLRHSVPDIDDSRSTEVVKESLHLAQQYLTHKSLPGSVMSLLQYAVLKARRDGDSGELGRNHVLGALSQVSGLPKEVLDERQRLDVSALADFFRSRIIGQDEAVDCLVERIAMLKAGLTDPGRPIGVFLFAGPTGTGKTEIAKTLAEVLFGSPEQMIRLDMSEFQDIGSISRLVGERHSGAPGGTLVDKIRENPFSVLLLDELEKAHPRVWDLFLQVFDDGRMTDSNGRMADFRHAIIILTSNLGATIANEAGIGFTSTSGGFSAQDVMRVVNRTFRREFLNRLDRVVVFQPLGRKTMRVILQKELEKALGRRGLRSKQWAVEWEDSALEFLLSEGFTPDLGARPLRRAIERHLLAPLSMTMVQNQAPDGEQFLFVRSDGEALSVEFVDPDSELSDDHAPDAVVTDSAAEMSLAALMLSSRVPENATAYLVHQFDEVSARTSGKEWEEAKSAYINEINSEKFWSRGDRHHVLDRVELIDRLDSAVSVLGKLTRRLKQHPGNRKLIKSVAGRLYVVKEGLEDIDQNRPTQAYLGLRLVSGDVDKEGSEDCLDALEHMYRRWAKDRGMRMIEIDADKSRYAVLFKVSGFGSLGILQRESGLHVFETPKGKSSFDRIRARVEVTGVPVKTPASEVDKAEVATSLLDAAAGPVEIVRRYRRMPSPLVRDSVRNWRSGRLDSVLAGNFDVIGALVTAD